MVIILVGNKSDLSYLREVNAEDGQSLAQLEGIAFMETSAKENFNVEEAFHQMVRRIHEINSKKDLEMKKVNDERAGSILQGTKEIICIDEVSASTKTSHCCSY